MRYLLLAVLITGSAALSGCFNDNDNDNFGSLNQNNPGVTTDQSNAELAVSRTNTVINTSKNINTDEPFDIDRIILPEANLAEPIAISNANASL